MRDTPSFGVASLVCDTGIVRRNSNHMATMRLVVAVVVVVLDLLTIPFVAAAAAMAHKKGGGGGFAKKKAASAASTLPFLSIQAQELLKNHHGNIDAASQAHFQSLPRNNHAERVQAAWDTVALFLPVDYERNKGKVEPYVQRRLQHIARACCSSNNGSLLDVGCGDGAIVPYCLQQDSSNSKYYYLGLDLSPEMIALAQQRYPQHNFLVGSFPDDIVSATTTGTFDCILFNGSLQFFKDTWGTLQHASSLLTRCPGSRLVISHAQGANFVRNECRSNPSVAVRTMPTVEQLQEWAQTTSLVLLDKESFLVNADESDRKDELFYLQVLETT